MFGSVDLGVLVVRGMSMGVSKGPRVWMPCEESVWEWLGYGV